MFHDENQTISIIDTQQQNSSTKEYRLIKYT